MIEQGQEGRERIPEIHYYGDDLSLIDELQYTLEACGYVVDNAKIIKEASALFYGNAYDLIF